MHALYIHVTCVCTCMLHVQTMLRIWDTFLYEGSKVLFRFALAIFKHNEEKILEKTTSIGIFNHLRTMCQHSTDVETLVKVSPKVTLLTPGVQECRSLFSLDLTQKEISVKNGL